MLGESIVNGSYAKLRAWAHDNVVTLAVTKSLDAEMVEYWAISCSVTSPVHFSASGSGTTIDEAADKVLADLITVGAE